MNYVNKLFIKILIFIFTTKKKMNKLPFFKRIDPKNVVEILFFLKYLIHEFQKK